ncbi:MAG: carbon-nitrogen hydrolase family protein, partial [Candidatus Promineifilaceae bacterium]
MKKVFTILLVVLVCVLGLYFLWSASGRTAAAAAPNLYLDDTSSFGTDTGSGNLVAVQTYMEPPDYASAEAYRAKIDGYLAQAQAQGWLQPDTIVVFPESIGTWLVAADEKEELYTAQNLDEAMQLMVLSNTPAFLKAYSEAKGEDKIVDSIFRMKSAKIVEIYQETFAGLAEKYGVTIVAGSLYLPEPRSEDGKLLLGDGKIQNVAAVFLPNGTLYPNLIRKIFLTHDELPFVSPGHMDQHLTFNTPAGVMGVLICADSWYLEPYETLATQHPDFIVVPNNYFTEGGWDAVWQGYDAHPAPRDVDQADIGRITEGEARLRYTLDGRMQTTGAATGMHVFSSGDLWNMHMDGHTIVF